MREEKKRRNREREREREKRISGQCGMATAVVS